MIGEIKQSNVSAIVIKFNDGTEREFTPENHKSCEESGFFFAFRPLGKRHTECINTWCPEHFGMYLSVFLADHQDFHLSLSMNLIELLQMKVLMEGGEDDPGKHNLS